MNHQRSTRKCKVGDYVQTIRRETFPHLPRRTRGTVVKMRHGWVTIAGRGGKLHEVHQDNITVIDKRQLV